MKIFFFCATVSCKAWKINSQKLELRVATRLIFVIVL